MRHIRNFALFLVHMIFGGHDYVHSNRYQGSLRCRTCRHVSHPGIMQTLSGEN